MNDFELLVAWTLVVCLLPFAWIISLADSLVHRRKFYESLCLDYKILCSDLDYISEQINRRRGPPA